MATLQEYAIISSAVYQDARGTDAGNDTPLPPGWASLDYVSDITSGISGAVGTGLSAGAYINGDEIVIAFKGTDFLFGSNNGQTVSDLLTDVGLGVGAGSAQLLGAVQKNGVRLDLI